MTKRCADVLGALAGLLLLSPLLAAIAALVKLGSAGPVLFTQQRLGQHGRVFRMYKFRTMHPGAPEIRNPDGSHFVTEHDPRLTPAGRFLRTYSLDELPQLWNVLRGDMSLVGPRPDQVEDLPLYDEPARKKLAVKPGIASFASTHGRNAVPWRERLRLEAHYIEHRSWKLDLEILGRVLVTAWRRQGVYCDPSPATLENAPAPPEARRHAWRDQAPSAAESARPR